MTATFLASAFAQGFIDALSNDLDGRVRFQLQFELGLLEMELGLMLSVLDPIESLEAPSETKKDWAKDARKVVRSVEDSIDTFRKRSGTLKRYCLCFNDFFIRFTLSSKIKRLMRRVKTLNNKSKLLDLGKDGGGAEERNHRWEPDVRIVPIMSSLLTAVYNVCAKMLQRQRPYKNSLWPMIKINFIVLFVLFQIEAKKRSTGGTSDLRSVRDQILNVRKDREGGDMSREENLISETNNSISSFLEEVEFVLREKVLFVPSYIMEVEQVRDDIKCLYDLLKDKEGLNELDEREKVWVEWVKEIFLLANDFLTSFKSKREQQINMGAKHKDPFFVDSELKTKMRVIKSRVRQAFGRKWIFGIGEYDETKCLGVSRGFKNGLIWGGLRPILERERLRASRGFRIESIWRDLRLIRAFIKDVEGMEDQSKRVEVWLKQMKGLALELDAFSTCIQRLQEKMKGGFARRIRKEHGVLLSIEMKKNEISRKFLVMSERKRTYDIGNFEGKRGQCPRVQDLPGTRASMTDTIVEDDDNNLEEAQPGSSQQQYTKTRRSIGEIEEISSEVHIKSERKRNYEMGKFEGKRVQSSTVQDLPGTTASMSDVIVKNVDNQLEKAQPSSVQEGETEEEVESFRAQSSQMNALIGIEPSTSDIVQRNYTTEQVESIITELELIEAFLEDVKAIEEPDSKLKFWEKQMKHIAEEAKHIIHIYGRKRSILEHPYHDNKIVREISMIKSKIQEITERRIAFGIEHVEASNSTQRRYLPSQYSEESVSIGSEDPVDQIKESLLTLNEPRHCVILIVGMERSGKTTLAESIFKDNSVHFLTYAWVSISSQERTAEEILQDILEKVKAPQELKGQQSVKDELKQMLRNFLREKSYLIVLDNLHMPRVWDDLKDAFPDEPNGSRILITTRDMTIPLDADSRIVQYKLQLPLEIENMGRLPSKKVVTDEEWSEISKIVISELPLELNRCLHYFLLFPEKFDIPKRRLTTLWVAEGFLRRGRDGESPEDFAERCLMELIDRKMVQVTKKKPNGKVRSCRLPGALWKVLSKDYKAFDRHSFNPISDDNTTTSTLQGSYKQSLSFLFFDDREGSQPGEEIGNFLHRCISCRCLRFLRVLDLERVFRPQLPKVLSKLDLLRYLGLRWTYLESLPSSISNLLKLQTLDLKHTYISTLPRSIWKMQLLRHLYLSESYRSRFEPRPSAASLKDLQTLWGAFVDEKSPVKDGLDTLINLRKLGVACRCMSNQKDEMTLQLKAVADWIEKLVNLQSLRLKSHDENNQPWDLHLNSLLGHKNLSSVYFLGKLKTPSVISEFPENLIELTLSASELTEDPMQKLDKLPKLRILQLFSESYVEKDMCCPQNGFPQLRVLKLWMLEKLENWTVEEGALSRLRDLEIRSCASLHKLPDGLQHVKTLQELKLSNMPREFTERIKGSNSEDWGKIKHVHHVIIEP